MAQPTPPESKTIEGETNISGGGQPLPPTETGEAVYENNPFKVAIRGIEGLFHYAKTIAIIMLVLSIIGVLSNAISNANDTLNPQSDTSPLWGGEGTGTSSNPDMAGFLTLLLVAGSIILIFTIIVWFVAIIINGIRDVSAAAVADRKTITLRQAFSTLFKRFGGYVWLQILILVKVLLWSLLFIIPGIIMAIRYSLAGTAFFARDMKASQALKHSTEITKGGWITTFASYGFFNLVTLGFISALIDTGSRSILFRQFDAHHKSNTPKPSAHALSIVYLVLVILLVVLFIAGVGLLVTFLANQPA